MKLKVLFVHNYYQQGGGEDKVVAEEERLLRSYGFEVNLYSVHNNTINNKNIFGKIRAAVESIWSLSEYKRIKKVLMDIRPDVVHVHNFFPLISPSVYYACKKVGIPVVQTLHNYRLLCPAATFLRDNVVCDKCLKGSLINSLIYSCYRGSRYQTAPLVLMLYINRALGTWKTKVNRYIALTDFSKRLFIQSGIPDELVVVKPNFLLFKEYNDIKIEKVKYVLFVGRLSPEKGIKNLIEAWKGMEEYNEAKLIIIGDGPEKDVLVQQVNDKNIIFLGRKSPDEVLYYMKHAEYLIVPSIWYEGFPMTIVEAYSVGTPVLCSRIGSLQEVVINEVTGFHFNYNDIKDIQRVIFEALNFNDYKQLRNRVREVFNTQYTDEVNFQYLNKIYKDVIEETSNERYT